MSDDKEFSSECLGLYKEQNESQQCLKSEGLCNARILIRLAAKSANDRKKIFNNLNHRLAVLCFRNHITLHFTCMSVLTHMQYLTEILVSSSGRLIPQIYSICSCLVSSEI